ncbi:Gfo/Idh/MocA family protein [Herbiconiux daphne]|uniref:Gfo/Idh/MocA family oxidoreductase n=1 Tax=Herbiconiux daphne TaxID=2970914 RepID=A0ABT2H2F0_9MICO|nr:Gfo/Idh/MocA family oxidoreductase [Herbiconiux daphne]MCS5734082.1 Gfo/Idh/MocA family oxidoreductase [Herbiconiux daphne]
MGEPHRIGIVGLGVISRAYLDTFAQSDAVVVTAVADLDAARAHDVAAGLPAARALSVDELLAAADVDTVLNLTVPAAHAEIAVAAVDSGKNVYGEKPLALGLASGLGVIEAASRAGRQVGSAPDTVLGTGLQTARAAIDDGLIGRPVAASAVMVTPGHERWHPNPDFYYRAGGGPLFDMGPYYVTALVHLLGPVRAVIGLSSRPRSERRIATGARAGEVVPVSIDTHVTGALEHAGGAVSTITMSFDGTATAASPIEVHGEEGTLSVPDPNVFDGDTTVRLTGDDGWRRLALSAGFADAARGVGLLDLVRARADSPARANGHLALHVLDVMESLTRSAAEGRRVELTTTAERPAPVPLTPREVWLAR